MSNDLISVLYNESTWSHIIQCNGNISISFSRDGTGELWATGDLGMGWVIACDMSWKWIPRNQPVPRARLAASTWTSLWTAQPEYLGTLELEITLHKTLARSLRERAPRFENWHDKIFHELAWQTRLFRVDLERGHFNGEHNHTTSDHWSSSLRLTFDESPYPLVEAYNLKECVGPFGLAEEWCTMLRDFSTFTNQDRPMEEWPPRDSSKAKVVPSKASDNAVSSAHRSAHFPGQLISDSGIEESTANNKAMSAILRAQEK